MTSSFEQLTLKIALPDHCRLNNFMFFDHHGVLRNELLGADSLWLRGAHAVGKTHLLSALAAEVSGDALYLPAQEMLKQTTPEMLNDLHTVSCLLFDDIDQLAADPHWAEALFHLYNKHQSQGGRWVCSSRTAPRYVDTPLSDLKSRFMLHTVYELPTYSDDQRAQILRQRASGRGLRVSDDVIDYFGAHLPRDLVLWMQLLELLDRASLRTQRKITLPLLKSVLADNPELSRQGSLY